MIKIINNTHDEALRRFLETEKEFNIYFYDAIYIEGYDSEFLDIYAELDTNGNILAVLMRYYDIFNFYAKQAYDIDGFVNIIEKHKGFAMLMGKTKVVSKFEKTTIKFQETIVNSYMKFDSAKVAVNMSNHIINKAQIKDIDAILNLRDSINEFTNSSEDSKRLISNKLKLGFAQGYYISLDNNIVSYAEITAQGNDCLMLGRIMTHQRYRRKGLAKELVSILCMELSSKEKNICIYVHSDDAEDMYKKIGFRTIGSWSIYKNRCL